MVLSGIFTRFLDENGTLGLSDEGWAAIEAKFANGLVSDDIMEEIVNPNNDVVMAQIWHMAVATMAETLDTDLALMVPEIGIPFSVEGVALINGANNPEGAQRFMDWFGSAEVMNAFGEAFDYLPANPNALEGLSAETIAISEIRQQEINWEIVAENMGAWLERIYLNYLQ
jgi:iron(III) transport system substrate-binding protein